MSGSEVVSGPSAAADAARIVLGYLTSRVEMVGGPGASSEAAGTR